MKYQVLSIDAWAGEEKGLWDCNMWFKAGQIEIGYGAERSDIARLMVEEGFLYPSARKRVDVEEISDTTIRICDKKTFQPLYDLVLIEGGE
jgi:hypothetical protein